MNRPKLLGASIAGSAAATVTGGTGAEAAQADAASGRPEQRDERCLPPAGPVKVTPDDPRYLNLNLRGANSRFSGKPDYIQLVGSTKHVVDAVEETVRDGKQVAVRSGGHCFEDFVDNPDVQVIIDMSLLTEIAYDPSMNAFLIEPGNTLSDVYEKLYMGWNVTIPGGVCGGVGVGGHICGGGYGPLSRQLGSVVDYLYAVEVVVVDENGKARVIVATRERDDPHHDLWWAHTGGGGGNFGVVTKYWMRVPEQVGRDPERLLPKPPAASLMSTVTFDLEGMTKATFSRLLRNHGEWYEQNSAPDSPYTGLWSQLMIGNKVPGMGESGFMMHVQVDNTRPDARRLLDAHIEAVIDGIPSVEVSEPIEERWLASSPGRAGKAPGSKTKAGYLRKRLTDQQIEAVYENMTHMDGIDYGAVWLIGYGGKVNTVDPAATALPQRDAILKVNYITGWANPRNEAKHLQWVRKLYADVYAETGGVPVPNDINDGAYINYPDRDLADPEQNTSGVPWHDLYYKENYPRLRRVKAAYDPRNHFHHALSIRP